MPQIYRDEKQKKDWHLLEFCMPITETATVKDEFFIRGMAINETTTRNGITYIAAELEKAAPSFRNKPILTDHENSVRNIVGRTTENVNFSSSKKGIEFEAKIMDESIKEMISDGRITDVSIGAKVEDLEENEDDKTITAIGLEGLEISLVAIPGDPGANIANALSESFNMKKKAIIEENNINNTDEKEDKNNNMAEDKEGVTKEEETEEVEAETETEAEAEEEEVSSEKDVAEEKASKKLMKVTAELAKYKKAEERAKLKAELKKEIVAEIAEDTETDSEDPSAEEEPTEKAKPEDETKGEVGTEEAEEEESADEGFHVDTAESGKGFEIWRDYTKDTGRFKRLAR